MHREHLTAADIDLLADHGTKYIFLLRKPESTVSSSMRTLMYTEEEAVSYYCSRVAELERLAERVAEEAPFVFVTYAQLLEETDTAFRLLEDYLALPAPLSEE